MSARQTRWRSGFGWMLLVIQFGAAVSPPAILHAHAPGEHDHSRHAHAGPHHHAASHQHQHGHHKHSHHVADSFAPLPIAHWHLSLLGIPLTLPASDQDSQDHGTSNFPMAVVPLLSEPSRGVAESLPLPELWLPWLNDTTLVGASLLERPTLKAPPEWGGLPLCDIARRERSGVQRT